MIGDFNYGKSMVFNVLFGKSLLFMVVIVIIEIFIFLNMVNRKK